MITTLVVALMATLFPILKAGATPKAVTAAPQFTQDGLGAKYKIVTASERGSYIVLGRDLATYVAPDAKIELEALHQRGPRRTSSGCARRLA